MRFKTWVLSCLIAGIAGSNLAEGMMCVSCVVECCAGSGLWDKISTLSDESY